MTRSRLIRLTSNDSMFKMKSLSLYVKVLILLIRLVKYLLTLSVVSISFNKNGDHISEQYSNNGLMYTLHALQVRPQLSIGELVLTPKNKSLIRPLHEVTMIVTQATSTTDIFLLYRYGKESAKTRGWNENWGHPPPGMKIGGLITHHLWGG